MTYDPTDKRPQFGLIASVGEADQHSQIARLTRRLDAAMDDIYSGLTGEALANVRGEARGLAYALTICTCYSLEEVKAQVQYRYEQRTAITQPVPRRKKRT